MDSAEERFRTMPARATNTIHFVSGGDAGIGQHAVQTNHVAAAQSPMFVVLAGDIAYENATSPAVFLQFLKTIRDLRDDHQRLIPLLGCVGNHEVLGSFKQTRKQALLLLGLRRSFSRDRLREPRFRRLPLTDFPRHESHVADRGGPDRVAGKNAQAAGGTSRRYSPSITFPPTRRSVRSIRRTVKRSRSQEPQILGSFVRTIQRRRRVRAP